MTIRELLSSDLKLFHNEILELLIDVYELNFHISKEQCMSICEEKIGLLNDYTEQGSAIVVGAIIDDELIGFLWLYKHNSFAEVRLHINQIVVKSEYRGKGIGKKLMLEAETQAKKNNINILELFVLEDNSKALNMYQNIGFETEKRYMTKKL